MDVPTPQTSDLKTQNSELGTRNNFDGRLASVEGGCYHRFTIQTRMNLAGERIISVRHAGNRRWKMSEEQTNFKVTDRRLFNPDGTPRDVPEDERPAIKPAEPEAIVSADA